MAADAFGMITASAVTGALARRLIDRAAALAKARAVMTARGGDARKWRKASLLWPLFGGE
ncbi:MAG: hypothetical protein B7Y89_12900 [Novosphingobium sp. 32-60-15]|uniref:hypothetical protein n=1 Tax=unclassified Novosphingobium TaxID=2644732 RepID=UPI000BCB6240|nr:MULTISPECIES: hypothetical protein [unclassified Novosphingobium]OYX61600.1 MAG: hypothetical protein B7Y89_12900 [Novosphingobium sp. 32-60-15]